MPDVFISYAREDRDRARVLAEALAVRGLSVWWDRKIVAGDTFDRAIEQQLESADSIVVLWSEHSVASEWVRNEAAVAAERGALVPALIAAVRPPLEFRRRHAADLTRWTGDPADPEFLTLCEGIAAKNRAPTNDVIRSATDVAESPGRGAAAAAGSPARNLAGRWNAEVVRAGLRPYQFTVDFEQLGDRLFGTVHYPSGDAGIQDGRMTGDVISFRTVHTPQFESAPAEIRFDGRLAGETLELILQDATGAGKVTASRTGPLGPRD